MIGHGCKRSNVFSLVILIIRLSCIVLSHYSSHQFSSFRFCFSNLYAVVRERPFPKLVCLQTTSQWDFQVSLGTMSGDHGTVEPPVPIPNTEVKRCSADDSRAKGPAKVGRRQFQPPNTTTPVPKRRGLLRCDPAVPADYPPLFFGAPLCWVGKS